MLHVCLLQAPVRDYMLSQFVKQPASILRKPEELEKVKCNLVSGFSLHLTQVLSIHSLRLQIMRAHQGILRILDDFPSIKAAYFIVGEAKSIDPVRYNFATTQYAMDPSGKLMAAEVHRSKPHQLITRDGKVVLNLFYIPHFTEVSLPVDCQWESHTLLYHSITVRNTGHFFLAICPEVGYPVLMTFIAFILYGRGY